MRIWLLVVVVFALAGCRKSPTDAPDASPSAAKSDSVIADRVVREQPDGKRDEVRIDEVEKLRRGSCSFHAVRHKVRPLSYLLNYARVGDRVIGIADDRAVSTIVKACGTGAPAEWW